MKILSLPTTTDTAHVRTTPLYSDLARKQAETIADMKQVVVFLTEHQFGPHLTRNRWVRQHSWTWLKTTPHKYVCMQVHLHSRYCIRQGAIHTHQDCPIEAVLRGTFMIPLLKPLDDTSDDSPH